MAPLPLAARVVLTHLVGYFRWTQTLPMLVAWASVWAILSAFAFVNFQSESFTVIGAIERLTERFPLIAEVLPDAGPIGEDQADGSVTFGDDDIRRLVLAYWGLASGVLYLLSLVWQNVVGPRPPRGLFARFRFAGLVAAGTFGVFLLIYATSRQPFHGGLASWLLVFGVLSLLPLGVSVYALTIGWVCDVLLEGIHRPDAGDHSGPRQPSSH